MTTATIKLTAAITLGGGIAKAGEIIEVSEENAKALILRGKAELATAADEDDGDDFPDLSKMNKVKLLEIAAQAGLTDITEANNKAEIVAAIEGAMKAKSAEAGE